jgi:hypothetical protein
MLLSGRLNRQPGGFVLVTAALVMIMLLGIIGLATDLARMYVARNELQAYMDAASIAAALELNGTSAGLDHARTKALNYPNKWNFNISPPQSVAVTFAENSGGPYVANPADPSEIKYVHVTGEAPVTVYFMPGFSSFAFSLPTANLLAPISRQQLLRADSTSGQFLVDSFIHGLLPYSPDSPDPLDAEFGFDRNKMYTLRWPPPGQRDQKNNWCDGDEELNFISPSPSAQRGFIDIGEGSGGNGSAFIRQAIISNVQTHPLYVGDTIIGAPGNRGTESDALRERYNQDMDTTSQTYAEYMAKIDNPSYSGPKGNGRRFVIVPINNPANDVVLGFAGFFLHGDVCSNGGDAMYGISGNGNQSQGGGNVEVCCAEYVGPAVVGGRRAGGTPAAAYNIKLFR